MASANIKQLLTFLGPDYTTKVIDGEECIYRKISKKYDIEVSGATRKNRAINVYVWDISSGARIIEQVTGIKSDLDLQKILNSLSEKYLSLS